MKKFLLIGVMLVVASFAKSQANTNAIITGFKTGNATQVAASFDNFIDLTLPSKEEIKNMGKNQAEIALKSFFDEADIKGFDVTSQRESGLTMYIAGRLTSKTKAYNVTILLKNKGGGHQITSIRIN
jgi:hypothetical protein